MLRQQRDVLTPLRQRRDVQVDDVEPVVQILAEAAFRDPGFHVAVAGGDEANIDLHRSGAAHRQHFLFLDRAQQLDLHGRRHFGDLVEKQRAAVSGDEQAGLADGAGESASFVAEQFVGQQFFVEGAAVHRQEGAVRVACPAAVVLVQGAREQFLAGAGFAGDQHVAAGGRDLARHIQQLLHAAVAGDDAAASGEGVELGAQGAVFPFQADFLQRLGHGLAHFVQSERLGDVVERAFLHGGHGGLQRGEAGDHDDFGVRVLRLAAAQEMHAIDLVHVQVGQDQVERLASRRSSAWLPLCVAVMA
jgi:hypothetical protein